QTCGARWLLEGVSSLSRRVVEKIAPASVQWTLGGSGLRVGDASLARDTLSSQGLACGISEALAAANINGPEDEHRFHAKQLQQRLAHFRTVFQFISACRFKESDVWKRYGAFIATNYRDGG